MKRARVGAIGVVMAALVGAGAWATHGDVPRVEEPPVDRLLSEAAAVVEAAPEAESSRVVASASPVSAAAEAPSSAVRFASRTEAAQPRAVWDLPRTRNERVDYWIDFLKGRNRDRTHLWLEREGKYGGYIRSQLRARGMPEDLLYLGMIESGLSPHAYSRAAAAGLWQFIAETGRRYGLEVSTYVDERRDPLAATGAALDYLTDLHERFGSWYLAAAAYNSGENRVERILRQRAGGRKGDEGLFWEIDGYLPRETRDYVPLMLAAAHIGKSPNEYGFYGLEHQAPLAFEETTVPGGVPLSAVAKAAGVDAESMKDLNPHLVRGMTPPGRSWAVRVPVGTAGRVAKDLDRIAKEERLATVEHRVRRGETLSHIARRYGVGVNAIRAANGWVNPRRIQVGQRIRVPVGSDVRVSSAASRQAVASWTTYRVRRGDTLWAIARRHGVTVRQLRSWNGIGSRIYPGQRIKIEA